MNTQPHSHHMQYKSDNTLITSAQATLHCLTGCVIGEVTGLIIGMMLGLGPWISMGLATILAYISGMILGLVPVARRRKIRLVDAFRIIWIGEVISIGVMELVINAVDYSIGGVQANSVLEPIFWIGLAVAIPAGFIAAWPVNWWLLERDLKACH